MGKYSVKTKQQKTQSHRALLLFQSTSISLHIQCEATRLEQLPPVLKTLNGKLLSNVVLSTCSKLSHTIFIILKQELNTILHL